MSEEKHYSSMLLKHSNLECLRIQPITDKIGDLLKYQVTVRGESLITKDNPTGTVNLKVKPDVIDTFRYYLNNREPFDMIRSGFMVQKANANNTIYDGPELKTSFVTADRDKVNKFIFLQDENNPNISMTQLSINTGKIEDFVKKSTTKEGKEKILVKGTINFKKTNEEIEKLQANGKVEPKDLYWKMDVSLFMTNEDYNKIKDNFGTKSSYYNVQVPLKWFKAGLNYSNKYGPNLTLNVKADNFTRFLTKKDMDQNMSQGPSTLPPDNNVKQDMSDGANTLPPDNGARKYSMMKKNNKSSPSM